MAKCKYCGQLNGVHKLSCSTQKIIIMDITKCVGTDCPVKEKCYRFTAKDSEYRQSYFTITPMKNGKCDMFWGENCESIYSQLKDITNGKG